MELEFITESLPSVYYNVELGCTVAIYEDNDNRSI